MSFVWRRCVLRGAYRGRLLDGAPESEGLRSKKLAPKNKDARGKLFHEWRLLYASHYSTAQGARLKPGKLIFTAIHANVALDFDFNYAGSQGDHLVEF